MDTAAPSLCSGKIKKPQEDAKPFNLLQTKGIISMQQLREKASAMNKDYYERGKMLYHREGQAASVACPSVHRRSKCQR